jgi:hypothetical protein
LKYAPGLTGNNEADIDVDPDVSGSTVDINVPNVKFKGTTLTGDPLQK